MTHGTKYAFQRCKCVCNLCQIAKQVFLEQRKLNYLKDSATHQRKLRAAQSARNWELLRQIYDAHRHGDVVRQQGLMGELAMATGRGVAS